MEVDDIYLQTNYGKDIFEYYLGHEIDTNKRYNSVFREEKNPSMAFYRSKNEGWRVKDFGLGNNVGPIEFVMLLNQIDFVEAKKKVIKDLRLTQPQYKQKFSSTPVRPVIKEDIKSKEMKFQIIPHKKEWDDQDFQYWDKYKISYELLESYNVYPISSYEIIYKDPAKPKVHIRRSKDNPLLYVYELMDIYGIKRYKIYCPLIQNKEFKWIGNTTAETIQGLHQLKQQGAENLIIASSLKDGLALYTMFHHFKMVRNFEFVAGNSESVSIPGDILIDLKSKYKKTFSFLDWDDAGKRFSQIYQARYRITPMNHLLRNFNVKDAAEIAQHCSSEEITEFLTSINQFLQHEDF